ncbi:18970_t:CDS:2 [Entrophospora sp. SA101]|nr:595_t:CDS:2 [Entrophospora sp. SA101]CAJ0651832.1 6696_t:CDS:2 [Entrophospora sp. SA101]CAJ0753428.1 18970_t:CDS:2 [Entrophospora sp. SA101]CAJ0823066.1 10540_t:CDS:2 [Entrophospora sp. SA101]CAJ0826791.1 1626_t:CDS:2 [Entrophospora sp. SA101]
MYKSQAFNNNEFDDNSEHEEEIEQDEEETFAATVNFNYKPEVKAVFCCQIDRDIHNDGSIISIESAQKTTDNNGSSFITYTIKIEEQEVKRRYSEFESLRKVMMKLYPTLIVPPIPEKHSIADYATMQTKAKEDMTIIEKRKRMLQTFLNRVAKHPQLSSEHVFHRFLEPNVSWNEVLHSPPLSNLPKNILQVYQGVLKNPDKRFVDSENFTSKFAYHIGQSMEKTNRRTWKRLNDLSSDYSELGAVYNGFSLNESDHDDLASAIEKVGQAVDSSYMATSELTSSLESEFNEPLQEYSQYAQAIKQVLKYRHLKHLQMELTSETLEKQKITLENLERSEQEARRLEEALNKERGVQDSNARHFNAIEEINTDINNNDSNGHFDYLSQNGDISATSSALGGSKSQKRNSSSSKLLSVLSHKIHGIMDVDPEATRRNRIGRTRDSIIQLDEAVITTTEDLKNISVSIQNDLDRFQCQKVCDIRDMLIAYAKNHIEWCQKNLNSWEEAKAEVEKVQT